MPGLRHASAGSRYSGCDDRIVLRPPRSRRSRLELPDELASPSLLGGGREDLRVRGDHGEGQVFAHDELRNSQELFVAHFAGLQLPGHVPRKLGLLDELFDRGPALVGDHHPGDHAEAEQPVVPVGEVAGLVDADLHELDDRTAVAISYMRIAALGRATAACRPAGAPAMLFGTNGAAVEVKFRQTALTGIRFDHRAELIERELTAASFIGR
jgi:hypothetical protein